MLSDIEIAQACKMKHIKEIAEAAHVDEKYIEQYGNYKAKIDLGNIPGADERGREAPIYSCYRRIPRV